MTNKNSKIDPRIVRIGMRLGTSAEDYLRWLLKLYKLNLQNPIDIKKLPKEKIKELREELAVFTGNLPPLGMEGSKLQIRPGQGWGTNDHLPTIDQIVQASVILHYHLNHFFSNPRMELPHNSVVLKTQLWGQESERALGIYLTGNRISTFEFIVFILLGLFFKKLRQCPEATCRNVFIAKRIDQYYCSVLHQNREAARKARGTPPDRIGKRGRPKGSKNKPIATEKNKQGGSHGREKPGRTGASKRVR